MSIVQQTGGFGICDVDLWTFQQRSCRYSASVNHIFTVFVKSQGTKRRSRPTGKTEKHQRKYIAVWESASECG